jgi:hypothetical protein
MSQSRIFDIILIGLAVVILIHLFYNNSLFKDDDADNGDETKEQMHNISFPSVKDVYDDLLSKADRNGGRLSNSTGADAHSVSRNNGPLHQTDKAETPFYHVANKTVTNNSVNSDRDPSIDVVDAESSSVPSMRSSRTPTEREDATRYTKAELKDLKVRKKNVRECNIQSDGDNGYHKFCNNDPSQLKTARRNKKVNRSGKYQDFVHKNKLVFADNYEGRLTSDPFDADAVHVNRSGMDMQGFLGNNPDNPFRQLKDVNGNTCNLDPEMDWMKRYIREVVLDGRDQCFCATDPSKSEFTRDEIDRYREQQIEFRDKINGTSKDFEDPVDKMNEITMTGIKAQNQSIANFYDSIVENRFDRELKGGYKLTSRVSNLSGPGFIMGSSIPTTDCITPPELNLEGAIPTGNYTQSSNSGGRHFLRDNWMYTNENPNNGGGDSTGVMGFDPLLDPNLIVPYTRQDM